MKTKKTWITEFLGLSLPERNWWDFAPLSPVNKFQQRSLVEEGWPGFVAFFQVNAQKPFDCKRINHGGDSTWVNS